ncbi:MAG: P-loop NTPase fold protein [Albidovulum sp.]|nr:P-loop NTPase fold protein [Albidovulum sp.]
MTKFNDFPIHRPSDDRFGIDPFAKTIARCILEFQNPFGSVVAVHGRWGSGKSSVINLVKNHLADGEQEKQYKERLRV